MSRPDRMVNRWQARRQVKLVDRIIKELLREKEILEAVDALVAAYGRQAGQDVDAFLGTAGIMDGLEMIVKERLRRGLTEHA